MRVIRELAPRTALASAMAAVLGRGRRGIARMQREVTARTFLTATAYKLAQKQMPKMSETEKASVTHQPKLFRPL